MIKSINIADSKLIPGLFKERADINREYLMDLKKKTFFRISTSKRVSEPTEM